MWRELFHSLEPNAQYAHGASETQFLELRTTQGINLSEDLKALLREFDGVRD